MVIRQQDWEMKTLEEPRSGIILHEEPDGYGEQYYGC